MSVLPVLGPRCVRVACVGATVRVQIGRVGAVLQPCRVRVGRVVLATVFGSSCRVSQFGVRVNPQGVVSCCIFRVLVPVSCWGRP